MTRYGIVYMGRSFLIDFMMLNDTNLGSFLCTDVLCTDVVNNIAACAMKLRQVLVIFNSVSISTAPYFEWATDWLHLKLSDTLNTRTRFYCCYIAMLRVRQSRGDVNILIHGNGRPVFASMQ